MHVEHGRRVELSCITRPAVAFISSTGSTVLRAMSSRADDDAIVAGLRFLVASAASGALAPLAATAALLSAARGSPASARVQGVACAHLARVAAGTGCGSGSVATRNSLDAVEARCLLSLGAADVLVASLALEGGSGRLHADAASAIADLAASRLGAVAKGALAEAGAVDALLHTLRFASAEGSSAAAVGLQCCRALGNLCFGLDDSGGSQCKQRVAAFHCGGSRCASSCEGGCGVAALVVAVRRGLACAGPSSAHQLRWALHAMSNAAFGRAPNAMQDALAAAGALEEVARAAAATDDARCATAALTAIANLAFRHAGIRRRLRELGARAAACRVATALLLSPPDEATAVYERLAEASLFSLAALREEGEADAEGEAPLTSAIAKRFPAPKVARLARLRNGFVTT